MFRTTGFGFKKIDGKFKYPLERNEHNYNIVIEKDAEIGELCCIARGSYRDTFIGEGTKIDNLVHVGHNAIIGKHNLIVAHSVIGGSTEIGDYNFIGMGALIRDHVKIGNHCTIGMGAVVTKDVADNITVVGNPARMFKK